MSLNESIHKELEKALDPSKISVMQGGIRYLEAHDVIRTANEIFGFGGWGFELACQPWVVEAGVQGQKQTPYEVWAVLGKLTVEGCPPITDIGTNTRSGTGSAGLEMAIKGAASDAIKRCLRLYGDRFGLVLYDKDKSETDIKNEWNKEHAAPTYPWIPELGAGLRQLGKGMGAVMAHIGSDATTEPAAKAAVDQWLKADQTRTVKALLKSMADKEAQG